MASNPVNQGVPANPQPVASPPTMSEKTPAASVQPVASKAPATLGRPKAAAIPPGYEIIRIRKPDGEIIRVMRPIKSQPATSGVPAIGSPNAFQPPQTSQKPTSATNTAPASQALNASQKPQTSDETTAAFNTAPTSQVPNASQAIQSSPKATTEATSPTASGNVAQPISKLETASKGFRIFHSMRRMHNRGMKIAQAFDPSQDYGFLEPGDIELNEDEDDHNNDDDDDDHDVTADDDEIEASSDTAPHIQGSTSEFQGNAATGNGQTQIRAVLGGPMTAQPPSKPLSQVNEKEIGADVEKPAPRLGRVLMPYSSHWLKWIVWIITTVTPLLFIGKPPLYITR